MPEHTVELDPVEESLLGALAEDYHRCSADELLERVVHDWLNQQAIARVEPLIDTDDAGQVQ